MYFKQIELIGFKSFADRTVVRLEPGITAIVGPNGCGKSNILDALRWALGEQKPKALRGSNMQDVIFNGSENRHPMGMAEVTVTFDNSDSRLPVDFAEVAITRRVYRSGESEYLINKAPCRLKDIQELIMDTGMGAQAYSMVGQGKMDMILSSKPEDRRYLFEEAAGVIKYKSRKKVALRRLENAEQNLLRLRDIIAEVERQMRSLKRQVNAAIRYRELTDELRALEIRAVWMRYSALREETGGLRARFTAAQDNYERVSASLSAREARHEEMSLAKLEVDRVLLARREGVHHIDAEMEKIERQIALMRQQIDFADEQIRRAHEEREAFLERAGSLRGQIAESRRTAEAMRAEIESSEAALLTRQEEHGRCTERVTQAAAAVESLRERQLERMRTRTKTVSAVESLSQNLENLDAEITLLYDRYGSENKLREELAMRLQEAQRAEAEKQKALDGLERRRESAGAEHAARRDELRRIDEAWQGQREARSSLEARLRSLRELRDTYEGFAQGVRAVMGAKEKEIAGLTGIIGPVGDLLSTDKKFERAIEAALGGAINNIVVEEAGAAKRAIAFLKEHNAGRVTFLPLDTIRGGRGDDGAHIRDRSGVMACALDVVNFDSRLSAAIENALHSTLIVETLDDAIRIARQENRYPRLVTLDGEVVSSAGAVTGGRTRHESRGLLGRSAEIAELEEERTKLDVELAGLAQRRSELNGAVASLAQTIESLMAEGGGVERELGALRIEIAKHTAELGNLGRSIEALEGQRDALQQRRAGLEAQRAEAMSQVDSLDVEDEALRNEMEAAQAELTEARDALAACANSLADTRVRMAEAAQRAEEAARNEEREQRALDETLLEAERRLEAAAEAKRRQAGFEEEIALNIERAKAFSESKEDARKKVIEAENQRQELLDEGETLEKELRELRERAREAQSEMHGLELALRHNEDQMSFLEQRIRDEYALALGSLTVEDVGSDEMELEAREKRVNELRQAIQRMGEVNLMAIEEYEQLEKRHSFLAAQADDLERAREVLLGVIARSDQKIREMFMETFNAVSDNFRNYFRRLFNGGQARVYLLDESDPLESGIEIEARPPGKKPQSISLLSGGESAMVAVALLFSIFKAKPSPFCVLDEVDAPLDDANIGRFLSLLEEFTTESQFVVITHNKQTMARADALYGVTQQERGVSQLVSVRFNEAVA